MSNIKLIIEHRKNFSWEEFQKNYPSFYIALDGFVNDAFNYNECLSHSYSGKRLFEKHSLSEEGFWKIKKGIS